MDYKPLTRLTASLSDPHSVANMAADVCHTLCSLHQNNEFHGDVKPQTIFRNESGLFCLTEPAGAPNAAFCPPEAPDTWGLDADTYALGRIMHWLLNGRQLAAQPLPNPRYADTVLTAIIMKACAADPRYRYPSAMEMLSDLEGYLSHKRKSVLPAVLGGILSAILVVDIVAAIWLLSKPAEPTPTLPPQPVHSHSWSDATCIAPETCEGCGEERGEPLGHDWIPGDCETPDTCHRCGATSGESSGHVWMEATFEFPEYCDICGTSRGGTIPMPLTWAYHLSDTNPPDNNKDVTIGDWDAPDGTLHEQTIRFWLVDRAGYHNSESTTYALMGSYCTFSCTYFLTDGTEAGGEAGLRIYGDGVLLSEGPMVSGNSILTLTVDVSGVEELTVECFTNSSSFSYCVVDATVNR